MADTVRALVARLRAMTTGDHERGCDGRCYSCSCGWDGTNERVADEAADLIEKLSRPMEAVAWREKLADAAYVVLRHSDYRPGTDNGLIPHDDRLVPLAIADVILALIQSERAV